MKTKVSSTLFIMIPLNFLLGFSFYSDFMFFHSALDVADYYHGVLDASPERLVAGTLYHPSLVLEQVIDKQLITYFFINLPKRLANQAHICDLLYISFINFFIRKAELAEVITISSDEDNDSDLR